MKDTGCTVDQCNEPIRNRKLGLCNRHYLRFRRHGDVHSLESAHLRRFEEKIDRSGDCWIWTGTALQSGYGVIHRDGKRLYAHRVSYETYVGPIPEGLVIDHLCRNPPCVNPDHLEAVRQGTNTKRGTGPTAVNAAKTHCIRNHPLSGANLYVIQAPGYRQCKTCHRLRRKKNDDTQ